MTSSPRKNLVGAVLAAEVRTVAAMAVATVGGPLFATVALLASCKER